MAATREMSLKRKLVFQGKESFDEDDPFCSDDSVKDKNYETAEKSESSDSSTENDDPTDNKENTDRGYIKTPDKRPPSRWRVKNLDIRKKEKAKKRRNLGHGYETPKGVQKPPRMLGPHCNCKNKCSELLIGKENEIFYSFWNLENYDKQNAYLFGTIQGALKKRTYLKKVKRQHSSKSVTFKYFIKIAKTQSSV